jgi:hypothetical protein
MIDMQTNHPLMKNSFVLPVHPLSLRFDERQPDLEKAYQSFFFEKYLDHIRICHWLAIFFYSVYIFLDFYILSENTSLFVMIRMGVVAPLFILGIVLSYFPWYKYFWKYMLFFYVLVTSSGYISMSLVAPGDVYYNYFLGIIACLVFGYTFIRL